MSISTFKKIAFIPFVVAVMAVSCEKKDPVIPNEEELITTLRYTLTPNGGGDEVILSFQDVDGDGGNAPIVSTDTIQANTLYTGQLELLNESVSPAEDITEEVMEESTEHQFFFTSSINDLVITYDDVDDDNNPLGVETNVSAGNAGTGTLTIILRHEPIKTASGVADGDITNAGGETDIEVQFNVVVQ